MPKKTITTSAKTLESLLTNAEKARLLELRAIKTKNPQMGGQASEILVRNEGAETVYMSFLMDTVTVADGMPIKEGESHAFDIEMIKYVQFIAGNSTSDFIIEAK